MVDVVGQCFGKVFCQVLVVFWWVDLWWVGYVFVWILWFLYFGKGVVGYLWCGFVVDIEDVVVYLYVIVWQVDQLFDEIVVVCWVVEDYYIVVFGF